MIDLARYDERLRRRQVAYSEGLHMLRLTRSELVRTIDGANGWGLSAVLSNAALVQLNIIINAFVPGAPTSLFQSVSKYVYEQTAKSGTRGETKEAKQAIKWAGEIGKIATEYAKKRGMANMVPGIGILTGLAQDSIALFDVAKIVSEGQREMNQGLRSLDAKITETLKIIETIGIERALVHDAAKQLGRTA